MSLINVNKKQYKENLRKYLNSLQIASSVEDRLQKAIDANIQMFGLPQVQQTPNIVKTSDQLYKDKMYARVQVEKELRKMSNIVQSDIPLIIAEFDDDDLGSLYVILPEFLKELKKYSIVNPILFRTLFDRFRKELDEKKINIEYGNQAYYEQQHKKKVGQLTSELTQKLKNSAEESITPADVERKVNEKVNKNKAEAEERRRMKEEDKLAKQLRDEELQYEKQYREEHQQRQREYELTKHLENVFDDAFNEAFRLLNAGKEKELQTKINKTRRDLELRKGKKQHTDAERIARLNGYDQAIYAFSLNIDLPDEGPQFKTPVKSPEEQAKFLHELDEFLTPSQQAMPAPAPVHDEEYNKVYNEYLGKARDKSMGRIQDYLKSHHIRIEPDDSEKVKNVKTAKREAHLAVLQEKEEQLRQDNEGRLTMGKGLKRGKNVKKHLQAIRKLPKGKDRQILLSIFSKAHKLQKKR